MELSQAIHIGECVFDTKHHLSGDALYLTCEILKETPFGQVWVSNTAHSLLSGAGLEFEIQDNIFSQNGVTTHILQVVENDLPSNNNPSASFFESILQSIENHIGDYQFSLEVLCREVGMSERQLQRKLKLISNKTPNQLIRSVRVHKAKEMILQQNKTVSEAAFASGFNSLSYFSKCFKEELGVSPSELPIFTSLL